jgi:hypothetical protein
MTRGPFGKAKSQQNLNEGHSKSVEMMLQADRRTSVTVLAHIVFGNYGMTEEQSPVPKLMAIRSDSQG